MSELRVKLEGESAHLGEVAAGDIARLILAVETAVARAATVVLGQAKAATGRFTDPVERASRLRLVRIEEGSVIPVLVIPESEPADDQLVLGDVSLGQAAVDRLLDAADPSLPGVPHPALSRGLVEIATAARVGDRYEAVTLDYVAFGRAERVVRIDRAQRERFRTLLEAAPPTIHPDAVAGTLVEADFERGTGRIRTATRPAVAVRFDEDMADEVQEALRRPSQFVGDVTVDEATQTIQSVALRRVEQAEQLVLGTGVPGFWLERSLDDLAREQQVMLAPVDPEALRARDATEDESDAFMAAIAEM